ncbi:hypothetical protein KFK09_024674 [Dendrobium nobile]|uniref:ENTH domain-containing protein n=1 Tax=Dendrobium nobile TaxID=94219 RepID=A0A8T3AD89_DENNO|nr:hypothetical protein KFK09_024674 [Dendrobium nobile]
MPSKLRRTIDAVKDHTSLSLALISGSSDIHVAVLRATSHDPSPSEERTVAELIFLASSSPERAVRSINRRLSRTRNWVVAVKSMLLISRGITDAGPDFRREALAATGEDGRRRLLDLSSFRDESGQSSPWDFTAFVRTLALYLDARLEASAAGKLLRRPRRCPVSSLKPSVLVDRIGHWQSLLDRAMGTRPTGQAKANRLVRLTFHSVVRESFDLYRDIADGISFLLDSFLHLPIDLWPHIFQASKASAKQFKEIEDFYAGCKKMGIGRQSEYPSLIKITDSLLETLEELLKEGEAAKIRSPPKKLILEPARNEGGSMDSENWELALLESMNELSIKCQGEGTKAKELGNLNQESPINKNQAFSSSFQNPFLRASNDKSLMAVTPSPSSFRAAPLKKDSMIAAKDRSLMMLTTSPSPSPSPMRFGSWDYSNQRKEKMIEEEQEDPFDELAKRERPPLMSEAARDFREQYHRHRSTKP